MASKALLEAGIEGDVGLLESSVIFQIPDESYLECNKDGFNILHNAAANNNLDFIQKAIDILRPEIIHTLLQQRSRHGYNPFHAAVTFNHVEVLRLFFNFYQVEFLPPEECPWLAMDTEGRCPLHHALGMDYEYCALEIWNKNRVMDIELLVSSIWQKRNILAVGMLSGFSLENNNDNNNRNNGVKANELYLFHYAACENNSEFIREAIKVIPPETTQILMSQCNEDGINPLHNAAVLGHTDIVRLVSDFYQRGRSTSKKKAIPPLLMALLFRKQECVSEQRAMYAEVRSGSDPISSVNQMTINQHDDDA